MKKITLFMLALIFMCASVAVSVESSYESRGSVLFKKHCSGCHRDAAKIKLDVNIIEFLRDPIPPMPSFNNDKISDKDAQLIANFIKLQNYYAANN
jgi:mono/diheme cytochrome c family protein